MFIKMKYMYTTDIPFQGTVFMYLSESLRGLVESYIGAMRFLTSLGEFNEFVNAFVWKKDYLLIIVTT